MTVHIFQCSTIRNRSGLTQDITGNNLPNNFCEGGRWTFSQTIQVNIGDPPRIGGGTAEDIIAHIERDGYYIVDTIIQTTERIVPNN